MYDRENLLRTLAEKMPEIKTDLLPVISALFLSDVIIGSSIKESFFKRIIPSMPVI